MARCVVLFCVSVLLAAAQAQEPRQEIVHGTGLNQVDTQNGRRPSAGLFRGHHGMGDHGGHHRGGHHRGGQHMGGHRRRMRLGGFGHSGNHHGNGWMANLISGVPRADDAPTGSDTGTEGWHHYGHHNGQHHGLDDGYHHGHHSGHHQDGRHHGHHSSWPHHGNHSWWPHHGNHCGHHHWHHRDHHNGNWPTGPLSAVTAEGEMQSDLGTSPPSHHELLERLRVHHARSRHGSLAHRRPGQAGSQTGTSHTNGRLPQPSDEAGSLSTQNQKQYRARRGGLHGKGSRPFLNGIQAIRVGQDTEQHVHHRGGRQRPVPAA